jgi:hypothetical protein
MSIATRDKCTTTSPSARGVRTCSIAPVMEAVDTAEDASDCDEDGITRPKLGQGLRKRKPFQDGAGLGSPGRWRPQARTVDSSGHSVNISSKHQAGTAQGLGAA